MYSDLIQRAKMGKIPRAMPILVLKDSSIDGSVSCQRYQMIDEVEI